MSEFLLVEEAPGKGLERPIRAGTTIGRVDCDIELMDPEVSRRHAIVRGLDGGLAIEDLGSTNGTFLNDRPVSGVAEILAGDRIRLGNTVLRLESRATSDPGSGRGEASGQPAASR